VASVIARLEAQRDCDYAAQLAQDAFESIIAREPDAKLLATAAAEAFSALAAQNFSVICRGSCHCPLPVT
jgi:hypothetical protein